jgi:pimeloyl-ACP methyl ester carboxylesterase
LIRGLGRRSIIRSYINSKNWYFIFSEVHLLSRHSRTDHLTYKTYFHKSVAIAVDDSCSQKVSLPLPNGHPYLSSHKPTGSWQWARLPSGTLACVDAWIEDFRKDIDRNDIPTMIIHGDDDRILPAEVTSRRQAKMIKNVKFIEIKGASHGLTWTHAEEINTEFVKFFS